MTERRNGSEVGLVRGVKYGRGQLGFRGIGVRQSLGPLREQGRELIEGSELMLRWCLLLSMAAGHLGSGHVLGTRHEGGGGVTRASKIPFGPTPPTKLTPCL